MVLLSALLAAVPVGPTLAQDKADDMIVGSLRYTERGPGASYDGIANALILSTGAPAAAAQMGGALQVVFEILENPALAEALGTDMQSVSDELRSNVPAGELPIRASYDAVITFQLSNDGGGNYHLESGSISWSTDNATTFSAGDTRMSDSFHGEGIESLDPKRDTIDLTFGENAAGDLTYTLEVDVTHGYSTVGSSEWSTPVASLALERTWEDVTLEGITPFGSTSAFLPPQLPGMFADQTKTVGYIRTGKVESPDSPIVGSETWTNLFGGSQVAQIQLEPFACTPEIVKPDPPKLVFDESAGGEISDRTELSGIPLTLSDGVHWRFPDRTILPFTTTYVPDDRTGDSVEFTWRKLTAENADFGEYDISFEYTTDALEKSCPQPGPVTVEVYFPIDAKNNPEGKDYNWFYYWMQTSARNGIAKVAVAELDTCEGEPGHYIEGDETIYVCHPLARSQDIRIADGARVNFIDTFAIAVIHEDEHRRNWQDWWGLQLPAFDADGDGVPDERPGYILDTDGDRVPDREEPQQGLDPNDPFSCRLHTLLNEQLRDDLQGKTPREVMKALGITDYECSAYKAELKWQVGSARGEDWASPGSQFGAAAP